MIAIFTSYACHCTTIGFNKVHGDWAGCAQEFLEAELPGAVVLTALVLFGWDAALQYFYPKADAPRQREVAAAKAESQEVLLVM